GPWPQGAALPPEAGPAGAPSAGSGDAAARSERALRCAAERSARLGAADVRGLSARAAALHARDQQGAPRHRLHLSRQAAMSAALQSFRFCASAELPDGSARSALVGGRPVAVARQGGRLYAFGALCPHQQADLSLGILEAGAITCADHLWRFELATGRCTSIPGAAVPVYA